MSVTALIDASKATLVTIVSLLVCAPALANGATWYGPRPQQTPQRIVSLAPSVTEALFALGAGGAVVGVTRYCDYPPEARARTQLGGVLDLNVEAVLALHPDLVIGIEARAAQKAYTNLGAVGVPVLEVPSDRLEDFAPMMSAIALATRSDASPLIERFDAAMRALPRSPAKRTLVIVEARPLLAAGKASFVARALELIGLTSVIDGALFPEVNREALVGMGLDLVLDLASPPADVLVAAPVLRVHDERLLRLSPRLPDALRTLFDQLPSPR